MGPKYAAAAKNAGSLTLLPPNPGDQIGPGNPRIIVGGRECLKTCTESG